MGDQVKFTNKLKGDKVLIIGGTSGIGYGIAEACIEHDCTVIISSSSTDRVNKKVGQLLSSYPSAKDRILGYACDLSDETTVDQNVKTLFDTTGTVDHVIYTAGNGLAFKTLKETDMGTINQVGQVRFYAPLFVAKWAPNYLTPGPKSSITLTTGTGSERPTPGRTVACSFATGLQGMARSMALDLKPIRVNIVSPGVVDTELWERFGLSETEKQRFLEKTSKSLPLGRAATPDDIAEAYIYLLKDKNITGTMISTNGGALLLGPDV